MAATFGACVTSALDEGGREATGEGRAVAGGFEAEVTGARDAEEALPDDLAEADCEKALTKPAAVFEARFPTDDDTLDAMVAVAATGR